MFFILAAFSLEIIKIKIILFFILFSRRGPRCTYSTNINASLFLKQIGHKENLNIFYQKTTHVVFWKDLSIYSGFPSIFFLHILFHSRNCREGYLQILLIFVSIFLNAGRAGRDVIEFASWITRFSYLCSKPNILKIYVLNVVFFSIIFA